MEITGEIRSQAELEIRRSGKIRKDLEEQIAELDRPSNFKHDGQVLKMPDLKSSSLTDYNNSCLVNIKKLEQESVNKLGTYDRIDEDLMS